MLCRPGGVASATCAAQDKDSDKPFDLGAALKRKQSTAATRRGDVVSLPASDRFESLEERHGKILEAGMQPFAGSWKEKLHAELFEPAFLNLVLATAEQKREKLLGSQQAGTAANIQDAAPPGHLPLQQATAVFDEILALYGVAIANRVAESHVPVPPVPTSVLKRWRQQYGVSAVSHRCSITCWDENITCHICRTRLCRTLSSCSGCSTR